MKSWTASQFQENQRFIAISRIGAIAGGMFGRTWNSRIFIKPFLRGKNPGGSTGLPTGPFSQFPGAFPRDKEGVRTPPRRSAAEEGLPLEYPEQEEDGGEEQEGAGGKGHQHQAQHLRRGGGRPGREGRGGQVGRVGPPP